jgi:hypothetical protein
MLYVANIRYRILNATQPSAERNIRKTFSQFCPANGRRQLQTYSEEERSMQVPPFWQGLLLHALPSANQLQA